MVSGFGFAYGDSDPIGPEARKGLTAAYGEPLVAQSEADPARFPITAYAAGVDKHERGLWLTRNLETHNGQLLHQVGPPDGDLLGRGGGKTAGVGVRQATIAASAGVDTDQGGC